MKTGWVPKGGSFNPVNTRQAWGVQVQAWGPAELRGPGGLFPASSIGDEKLSGAEAPPILLLVTPS